MNDELQEAADQFLRAMEKVRGNEYWTPGDEAAYLRLESALKSIEDLSRKSMDQHE